VRVAAQVVRLLDERAPREMSMAVIAMYAEQVERLRQALGRRRFKRVVKIDTVDSFEGREEDIVVISLVRSNERGRIGFLRVPNRLNVAISRAKRLVACIGDSATLRSGDESMYGMLVEAARSTGGWMSALELVSQPKPRRGEPRPAGQPGGGETGDETDPERAAKRRRRRRRGRRGGPAPVTASTEVGTETGGAAPPTVDGQPGQAQEGAQRRRRRRRRRGRGRGPGLGPAGQSSDTPGTPPDEQPTVAPAAAGDVPEA
jgi:AAA domain